LDKKFSITLLILKIVLLSFPLTIPVKAESSPRIYIEMEVLSISEDTFSMRLSLILMGADRPQNITISTYTISGDGVVVEHTRPLYITDWVQVSPARWETKLTVYDALLQSQTANKWPEDKYEAVIFIGTNVSDIRVPDHPHVDIPNYISDLDQPTLYSVTKEQYPLEHEREVYTNFYKMNLRIYLAPKDLVVLLNFVPWLFFFLLGLLSLNCVLQLFNRGLITVKDILQASLAIMVFVPFFMMLVRQFMPPLPSVTFDNIQLKIYYVLIWSGVLAIVSSIISICSIFRRKK